MRFRHIHLDFHTHQAIPGIGAAFTKEAFQEALRRGRVDSINLFAKCHHGYSYHPTEVGCQHPNLAFDLLGAQIEACREIDVHTPVYLSAGLDEYYARVHPATDWARQADPSSVRNDPFQVGFKRLCFNTPYLDYLCRQIEEVVQRYRPDGIWLDIVGKVECVCGRCQAILRERGDDPLNPVHVSQLATETQARYFARANEAVHRHDPDMPVFHNQGHIPKGDRKFMALNSHLEVESLPTGSWGYDHFPLTAKDVAPMADAFLGMTGKFHTVWGEFGGYKHPDALRYECAMMNAYGARCCVGDQLHPDGRLDPDTYDRIGQAYTEVEAREPYLRGCRPVSRIAILSIESLAGAGVLDPHLAKRNHPSDLGAARMLMERQVMFDLVDSEADFSPYELLILPDEGRLDAALTGKLRAFIAGGGKLILSHHSGLAVDDDQFALPVGTYQGETDGEDEYYQLGAGFPLDPAEAPTLVRAPVYLLGPSARVETSADAEVWTETVAAYFNRRLAHFCSHQHAPPAGPTGDPACFRTGNIVYFAHKIFRNYAERGQLIYRDTFHAALTALLGDDPALAAMPSAGRVSLMDQPAEDRYILHLACVAPVRRGDAVFPRWNLQSIEVIEDVLPLHDVACRVRTPRPVKQVQLTATGEDLPFRTEGDAVLFTVPRLEMHRMITLAT